MSKPSLAVFSNAYVSSSDSSDDDTAVLQWKCDACLLAVAPNLWFGLCRNSAFEQFTRTSRKRCRTCLDINPDTKACGVLQNFSSGSCYVSMCAYIINVAYASISCQRSFDRLAHPVEPPWRHAYDYRRQ